MEFQLGSEAEARIQERLNTGKFATPADVVLAALDLLDAQQQQQRVDHLDEMLGQVSSVIKDLDRGQRSSRDELLQELLAD